MALANSSKWTLSLHEAISDRPLEHAQSVVHGQLDSSRAETRICRILPIKPNRPIKCELRRVSLDDKPAYACLSYAWGQQNDTVQILLDGQTISITANLHLILERLRRFASDKWFWIDLVCINQSDGKEKGEQVELMGRIYRQATDVFVWLGPQVMFLQNSDEADAVVGASQELGEADGVDEAVAMLQLLAQGAHFHELPYFGRCHSANCWSITQDATRSWHNAAESLIKLLEVPWFTRTWVVQEIALARNAVLMHGECSMSWDLFVKAWSNWHHHSQTCCADCVSTLTKFDHSLLHRLNWQILDLERVRQQNTSGHSLLRLLQGFRGRKATDGRDKIYGMLGLVQHDSPDRVVPHYTSSVVEVYTNFAAKLIRAYDWLVPLHLQLDHNVQGLPSWVPDWTFCDGEAVGYSLARLTQARSYSADSFASKHQITIVEGTLSIDCVEIDTVERVSTVFTFEEREEQHLNLILSWRAFLDLDTKKDDRYVCGGTWYEAYQATVFADRFQDEHGVRPLDAGDFEAWEAHLREITRRSRGEGPKMAGRLDPYMFAHNVAVLRRRLCVLSKGYIGLCPARTEVGDKVCVLDKSPAPIFLRPVNGNQVAEQFLENFRALGHGYVHGITDGEVAGLGLAVSRIRII